MDVGKISANSYNLTSSFLFSIDQNCNQIVFEVPMYQRPYVWQKENWEDLFDDITGNDKPGYFIGAIICINHGADKSNHYISYEVVDGQQRLTTLSLFLAAIHKELIDRKETLRKNLEQDFSEHKISLEEYANLVKKNSTDVENLERSLTVPSGNGNFKTRVLPQNKDNVDDYFLAFISAGLITEQTLDYDKEINKNPDGRRSHLITKAYEYFKERIVEYAEGEVDTGKQIDRILEILKKVNSTQLVVKNPTPKGGGL